MVMRSDVATGFPQGRHMETNMAKKQMPAAQPSLGDLAHAGMRHLDASGRQSVSVQQQAVEFAELADEGPTARSPRPYNTNKFTR